MEKIGQKIKRLRNEKSLKQATLHTNQAAVSQIESGRNNNPSRETLMQISKNLEITFEELVDDTNWEGQTSISSEGEYAYSQIDFNLTLNQEGEISLYNKSYPRYDINGIENIYCPATGLELLINCNSCKKAILSGGQRYCMGCGDLIFCEFEKSIDEFHNHKSFTIAQKDNKEIEKIIKHIKSLRDSVYGWNLGSNNQDPKFILNAMEVEGWTKDGIMEDFNQWIFEERNDALTHFDDFDEYVKGINSANPEIRKWHIERNFEIRYYEGIILELNRYLTINNLNFDRISRDNPRVNNADEIKENSEEE